MNKYGIENFEIAEIDRADDRDQLDDIEELWIAKLGTTDRNRGYNISFGGSSRPHPETRARLSTSLKGKSAWNKGKPMGEEHYQNVLKSGVWGENKPQISAAGMQRIREAKLGDKNPNFGGKSVTEETRRKHSEYTTGRYVGDKNPMFKKKVSNEAIRQLRSIGLSQQRISEIVGCSQGTVGNRLNGWPENMLEAA
jgi:hypothetical protein